MSVRFQVGDVIKCFNSMRCICGMEGRITKINRYYYEVIVTKPGTQKNSNNNVTTVGEVGQKNTIELDDAKGTSKLEKVLL